MLDIRGLSATARGGRRLLDNVSLQLQVGEIVGLTGESGCGKTTMIKSVMGLLRSDQVSLMGEILLDGVDLLKLSVREHAALRGTAFSLIPQTPMTAFDPSVKIGGQMIETFIHKLGMNRRQAGEYAAECLSRVNLSDVHRVLRSYPGQLSGGMLQRAAVGLVFGLSPKYIFADEPTSALDEANCEIITDLLCSRREEMGVLLISHDANALKRAAKQLLVMHEGQIVDRGETRQMFLCPGNPHTAAFVRGTEGRDEGVWQWER